MFGVYHQDEMYYSLQRTGIWSTHFKSNCLKLVSLHSLDAVTHYVRPTHSTRHVDTLLSTMHQPVSTTNQHLKCMRLDITVIINAMFPNSLSSAFFYFCVHCRSTLHPTQLRTQDFSSCRSCIITH